MVQAASALLDSYDALRRGAGLVDRSDRAHLLLSGSERRSYLQGLLTNDVAALLSGEGCYAAYLTPQGRMIADLWVYELGDRVLLGMWRDVKDVMLEKLEQFIFSEDVQVEDASRLGSVAVVGARKETIVAAVLADASEHVLASLAVHGTLRARFQQDAAIVMHTDDTGEPGFEVVVDRPQLAPLRSALSRAGAVEINRELAEALRIQAGIPRFHQDMDEDTIPLEAGLESRAISFTKGCYVGQEVIVRVLHRGHGRIAKKLVGLAVGGDVAAGRGTPIQAERREIGRVTSSAWSPALGRPVALGYVHRDFIEPGTVVAVGGQRAVVTALPFVPPITRAATAAG
jgi:folate-binding protein YgfZ